MDHKQVIDRLTAGDYSVLDELNSQERALMQQVVRGITTFDPTPAAKILKAGRDSIVMPVDEFLKADDFMGPEFSTEVYDVWRRELNYVLDPANEINLWFIRGSMGGGKSWAATLALVYKMYEVSTLKDPAGEYGLARNSPIVCGLFNATKYLADDVDYGYLTTFLSQCGYFASVRDQIRSEDRKRRVHGNVLDLPKGIRVALGSDQFMVMGKNILWGLLDEANWRDRILTAEEHDKIYGAFQGILRRIKTRFIGTGGYIPGMLFAAVSSEREMSPTMDRLCEEYGDSPHTHITQFSIWEVKPEEGDDNVFYVGIPPQSGIPPRCFDTEDEAREFVGDEGLVLSAPQRFRPDFEADVMGSLNDFAGVRVETGGTKFFYMPDRIEDCVDQSRVNPIKSETVVHGMSSEEALSDYFMLNTICTLYDATTGQHKPRYFPSASRVLHTDLAINHDAVGVVCGCLGSPIIHTAKNEIRRVQLPENTVHIDFLMRILAPPGSKIHFSALRQFILWLHQTAGFHFGLLSWDGFESEDSNQIMEKRGYKVTKLSVDKTLGPYSTLRDIMQYVRMSMPNHEYVKVELKHLEKVKKKHRKTEKVDHPRTMHFGTQLVPGSKDVADGLASVASHLITKFASQPVVHDPKKLAPPMGEPSPEKSLTTALRKDMRPTMRDIVMKNTKKQGGTTDG